MKVNLSIATNWNELNDWQIKKIGRFMFNKRNEQVETKIIKIYMFIILFQGKPGIKNFLKKSLLFWDVPFSELEQHVEFIFNPDSLLTVFPEKLKTGIWPWSKKVYGPMARLSNISIKELSYADTFYYKWATERNLDDLHRLCAILYRPKAKKPSPIDCRVEFSSLLLEKNAQLTDGIPLEIKFMIARAYEGCRITFIQRYKNVFPKKKQPDQPKQEQKPKPYQPFSRIISAMAMDEVQIFGNYQQVEKVLAPEFLSVYDESIARERERERLTQTKK